MYLFQVNPDGTNSIVNMTYNAGKSLTGVGRLMTGAKVKLGFYHLRMCFIPTTDFSNLNLNVPIIKIWLTVSIK